MLGRFARGLGWLAYVGLLGIAFAAAGYFSFSLFVRSGATAVPDLVGLPESEVEGMLGDQGLRLRRKYDLDRYDEEIPTGHILEQSPGSGSMVKRGAAIEVSVSMGPERLTVPDLGGKTLQAAQVLLTSADLTIGRIVSVNSRAAQPGTIVEQVPPADSKVGRTTSVALFLSAASRADRYVMPDLAYRDLETARLFFERRGFRFGSIKFEPYEGLPPSIILRQYPLPGHLLHRQDLISLVVTTTAND
jgi:beta-lactam-binding protein with PASTA domain